MSEAKTILEKLACGTRGCPCERSARDGRGNTHCPAHKDAGPSLSVTPGGKVPTVLHCFGGCDTERDVIPALREIGLWRVERIEVRRVKYRATRADGSPFAVKSRIEYDDGSKRFEWPRGTWAGDAPLWRFRPETRSVRPPGGAHRCTRAALADDIVIVLHAPLAAAANKRGEENQYLAWSAARTSDRRGSGRVHAAELISVLTGARFDSNKVLRARREVVLR